MKQGEPLPNQIKYMKFSEGNNAAKKKKNLNDGKIMLVLF